MKSLIFAMAVVTLGGGTLALAQSGGSGGVGSGGLGGPANPSVPPTTTAPRQAPIGHLQPRRSDTPSERSIDQIDPADAALDRKIKSICRGC